MLETSGSESSNVEVPLLPRPVGCRIPLTENQMISWKGVQRSDPPLSVRLRAAAVHIFGPLDSGLLQSSIEHVVRRHESLRTRIVAGEGEVWQEVDVAHAYHLKLVDLSYTDPAGRLEEAERLAQKFVEQKIDLTIGPLFDARLLKLSDQDYVFLLVLDHMVGDGVSNAILNSEIWTLYDQAVRGMPASLGELRIQHPDYAVWLKCTYESRRKKHEGYWNARITGAPKTQIPVEPGLVESRKPVGEMMYLPFGKQLTKGLHEAAKRERTLLPILALTSFVVAASYWCRQEEVSFFFVSHGRYHRPELQNMIGDLGHLLYFRVRCNIDESLITVLQRAHVEFVSGVSHQDYLPEMPEDNTELGFNWGGLPTYSARWSVEKQRSAAGQLRIQPFAAREVWLAKFMVFFSDSPSGIVATVNYRPDLLTRATIETFGRNMRQTAEHLVNSPATRLAELALL